MGKIITVDFRPKPAVAPLSAIEKERAILAQLERLLATLQARAAGPDCPPGVGWRRGQ